MSVVGTLSNVCSRKSANSSHEASAARSVTSSVVSLAVSDYNFHGRPTGLEREGSDCSKAGRAVRPLGDLSTEPRVPGAGSIRELARSCLAVFARRLPS